MIKFLGKEYLTFEPIFLLKWYMLISDKNQNVVKQENPFTINQSYSPNIYVLYTYT